MKIDCISDLHGFFPELEGGDLLIIAGDLTAHDQPHEYVEFREWLQGQQYRNKIVIGGNHDVAVEDGRFALSSSWLGAHYLCDSGCTIAYQPEGEGSLSLLHVWGSPWTAWFYGINPRCKAWTLMNDEKLSKKWDKIPKDTDILITHTPPYGFLDMALRNIADKELYQSVGSQSLMDKVRQLKNLKMHVFGHIHEAYGEKNPEFSKEFNSPKMINCAHVNRNYEPVNKPIMVVL